MDGLPAPDALTPAPAAAPGAAEDVVAVAIGRNEGERLRACLAALQGTVGGVVYVDSGSTDDSLDLARQAGAEVVRLDTRLPFTAARARNAGLAAARAARPHARYVQFIDGDCALRAGWIATARAFLEATPRAAVACGRRRERFPEASVYNRLCDREWDTPPGRARACGGDALMRLEALAEVGGYRDALIAGEEPELCLRLRARGWEIWRLDAEMTWHDAAITRFGQWWRRARRGGFAFAAGAALHGAPPERHWVAETSRAILWGAVLPAVTLLGALVTPWALGLLLVWPLQILRLARRGGLGRRAAWEQAVFTTLARLPEAQGALEFHLGRLLKRRATLIEYK